MNTIALAGFFFFKTLLRLTDYGSSRREYSITEPFVSKTVYLNRKWIFYESERTPLQSVFFRYDNLKCGFVLIFFFCQVEVKPYVLDDQMCDECQGARCGGKFAPFFCANVTCLQYYCEYCWASIHSRAGREFHKPLVKEGGDRPRHVSFRWSWGSWLSPRASPA